MNAAANLAGFALSLMKFWKMPRWVPMNCAACHSRSLPGIAEAIQAFWSPHSKQDADGKKPAPIVDGKLKMSCLCCHGSLPADRLWKTFCSTTCKRTGERSRFKKDKTKNLEVFDEPVPPVVIVPPKVNMGGDPSRGKREQPFVPAPYSPPVPGQRGKFAHLWG